MKPCVKCGSVDRRKNGDCRPCALARDRAYKSENRIRLAEQSKVYYGENKQACSERNAKWRKENAEFKAKKDAEYRLRNPERVAAHKKNHYLANIDKVKQRSKDWVAANPQRAADYQRQYRSINPESKVNTKAARRLRVGDDRLPYGTIPAKLIEQLGLCACCGEQLVNFHVDHIMPLALGGRNIPENIQLLLPVCNRRKSAKHPDVWRKELGIQNPQISSMTS